MGTYLRLNSSHGWALGLIVLSISPLLVSVSGYFVNNQYHNASSLLDILHRPDSSALAEIGGHGQAVPYSRASINQRKSKFFPLFTILRFNNDACRTTTEELGVCYTRSQCTKGGGIVSGSCAQGLGVCCQFVVTCGAIINQNGTLFRNPDFPTKYRPTGSDFCQVRIRKQLNICQLRLNFISFELDQPAQPVTGATPATNDAGTCKTDALTVASSGAIVPTVCGVLTGQHMYINFGSSDTITLSIMLNGNVNRDREWSIQVLMLSCRSEQLAPPGCLQYFQTVSGQVTSFNWAGGTHLINMDYSVCVRLQDGMRSIEWSACNPGDVKISGLAAVPPVATTLCGNLFDYLIIPQGVTYPLNSATALPTATTCINGNPAGVSCTDRFCDVQFANSGAFIRSSAMPFFLHFRSDGSELSQAAGTGAATATTDASTGFCLRFQQTPQ